MADEVRLFGRLGRRQALLLCLLGATVALSTRVAGAYQACTAEQVYAQEPSCPGGTTTPCVIRSTIQTPTGLACDFDFGQRLVVIGDISQGRLQFGSSDVTLRAGSLTVHVRGSIEGVGTGNDTGGVLRIETSGSVSLLRSGSLSGQIDVSGLEAGGMIEIEAGNSISLAGRIDASGKGVDGSGGGIRLAAQQTISTATPALGGVAALSANGSYGEIELLTGGGINVNAPIEFSGNEAGALVVEAGGDVILHELRGSGVGESAGGGSVEVSATGDIELTGAVAVRGSGSPLGGGDGGTVDLTSSSGSIVFGADVRAHSGTDAGGGKVSASALGDVVVTNNAVLTAAGFGAETSAGDIELLGDRDVVIAPGSTIDATAGLAGGTVWLDAGRALTIGGTVTVTATAADGFGGIVVADACDVALSAVGQVRANGVEGGDLRLTSRQQMTLAGLASATRSSPQGSHGVVRLRHPIGLPAPSISGTVSPAPEMIQLPLCTAVGQVGCLVPCPVCGDGEIDFPETCDTAGVPAVSCDGCSATCQTEIPGCDDGFACTIDSCDPDFSCRHLLEIGDCNEPTRTQTPIPTATAPPAFSPTVPAASETETPTPRPCAGDCDGDGALTQSDWSRAHAIINLCEGAASGCAASDLPCNAADLDQDGLLSAAEATRLLAGVAESSGACPP